MTTSSGPVDPYTGEPYIEVPPEAVAAAPSAAPPTSTTPSAPVPETYPGAAPVAGSVAPSPVSPGSEPQIDGERHPYSMNDFGITPRAISDTPEMTPRAFAEPSAESRRSEDDNARRTRPSGEVKEKAREWVDKRAARDSDPGIWVPMGFGTLAFAAFLSLVLFRPGGEVLIVLMVVLVIALALTVLSALDVARVTRRRRKAGEDLPHAIGLE